MTLGDTIASEASAREEALDLNETWPFVTTHDFELKAPILGWILRRSSYYLRPW
jgi:hypothetical protein